VGVDRLTERFSGLELALPVDQLPWRSSPFMRGLRSLPVRYELASAPALPPRPAHPPTPVEGVADAAAVAEEQDGRQRSSLWRYLTGLIGKGR
jgi:hypothetical protein